MAKSKSKSKDHDPDRKGARKSGGSKASNDVASAIVRRVKDDATESLGSSARSEERHLPVEVPGVAEDADARRAIEESTAIAMRAISAIEKLKREKSEQIARGVERAREYEDRTHALLEGFGKERSTLLSMVDRASAELEAVRDDLDQERVSSESVRRALESKLAEKEAEAGILARDVQAHVDRIAELARAKDELARCLDEAAARYDDAMSENAGLKHSVEELEQGRSADSAQMARDASEIERLSADVARLEQQVADVTGTLARAAEDLESRRQAADDVAAELAALRAAHDEEVAELRHELSRKLQKIAEMNDESAERESLLDALRTELAANRNAWAEELDLSKRELERVKSLNDEAVAAIEMRHERRLNALRSELFVATSAGERQFGALKAEFAAASEENVRLSEALATEAEIADALREELSALNLQLAGRNVEIERETARRMEVESEAAQLARTVSTLESRLDDLRRELDRVSAGAAERHTQLEGSVRDLKDELASSADELSRARIGEQLLQRRVQDLGAVLTIVFDGPVWRKGERTLRWKTSMRRWLKALVGTHENPYFDRAWYLDTYPDVRASLVDPYAHYMKSGWREGRQPNALFDPAWYLAEYPDVRHSGIEPLTHYWHHGAKEGRRAHPMCERLEPVQRAD